VHDQAAVAHQAGEWRRLHEELLDAVENTIEELVRGTLETGRTSRFSLRNRGVGLGTISAAVPRSFKAEIEDVRAEIVAGKVPIASSLT